MSYTWISLILFAVFCVYTNAIESQDTEALITGGEYAVIDEYPHLVLLSGKCGVNKQWICGGSILNQKILLSAAHCFEGCQLWLKETHKVVAFFGSTLISGMKIQRTVEQLSSHRYYDEITGENDIALVIVKRDIPLGAHVKRVIIPQTFPRISPLFEAFVAGWGEESVGDEDSDGNLLQGHLRKTYQKLRSPESCSRYGKLYDGMFCAGRMQKDGEYPALGDSGSALVTRNQYYQIGLVSFGWVLYPAMTVYTNISYFRDWIELNSKKLYCISKTRLRGRRKRSLRNGTECSLS